mmetsp:Transcript_51903/g.105675  ORF Transcript_51903/g.105675 Transcript_51903/m.105675 type:complete len:268 (-) Transcript_51903:148-951(-)
MIAAWPNDSFFPSTPAAKYALSPGPTGKFGTISHSNRVAFEDASIHSADTVEAKLSEEDENPAVDILPERRGGNDAIELKARAEEKDETFVIEIPIYIPMFLVPLLEWLQTIEIIWPDDAWWPSDAESNSTNDDPSSHLAAAERISPVGIRRWKSWTWKGEDFTQVGTQTEWGAEEEYLQPSDTAAGGGLGITDNRAERLQRRLELVESGKTLLLHRLHTLQERLKCAEEEREALASYIVTSSVEPLPSAAPSTATFDMSYASFLGL